MELLGHMLAHFNERGWIKTKEQRTDSKHVVAAIKQLNRLEVVGEALQAALSALAVIAPVWLREQIAERIINSPYSPKYAVRICSLCSSSSPVPLRTTSPFSST